MHESTGTEVSWVRAGVAGGLWACIAYPVAVFAPLPLAARAAVAASFGPALAFGCAGLWRFIRLHHRSVAAAAAAGLNALGGALFTAMALVQMAGGHVAGLSGGPLQPVWLGLDVAWDAYIGAGTILFGVGMLRHPRLGRAFGGSGIVLGSALLVLNLSTFPIPPADAGLVDLGTAVGLWYLVVTVQMGRSLDWARRAENEGSAAGRG